MATSRESQSPDSRVMRVQQANSILEALHGRINSEALPDFGLGMLHHSRDSIIRTTIGQRVLKKFQRPIQGRQQALRQACFRQWIAYEEELSSYEFYSLPSEIRSHLYKARELIHSWCAGFKRDQDVIEFTPGETFVSKGGLVSVYQKLADKEAWCVTHDARDDFIRLCYNNLSLKRCAKALMPKLNSDERRKLYLRFREAPHVGYAVFHFLMETFVVTVVHGSRASSVRKNNDEERFINVEPLGNMLLQRQCAIPLKRILSRVGNDLEMGQQIHRRRISDPNQSTVDFSKASDSVLHEVVKFLFPSSVSKLLSRYRSPMVLIDGTYYVPHKLSSMGCGFTFEVMSMILLALARVLDPYATVYGDDVIIETPHAARFIEIAGGIRFKVNEKKTFVGSVFRESCGAFFLDDYGYIKCFDLHWLECENDILIAINKLYLIGRDNSIPLPDHYREAYEALLRLTPALQLGFMHDLDGPDLGFAIDVNARRKHMRSKELTTLRKRNQYVISQIADSYQVKANEILLTSKPKFVSDLASSSSRFLPNQTFKYASYLYGGRVTDDVWRGKGKWVTSLVLVHPEFSIGLRDAQKLVATWYDPPGLYWVRTRVRCEWMMSLLTQA